MNDRNDLLQKVSDTSTESEFFSPAPTGYKKGKTRYVFVMGTVMNGFGILVGKVKHTCDGIDTPQQYAKFVKRYKKQ